MYDKGLIFKMYRGQYNSAKSIAMPPKKKPQFKKRLAFLFNRSGQAADSEMQIFVKILMGKTITLESSPVTPLRMSKPNPRQGGHPTPDQQHLITIGTQLENGCTPSGYNIQYPERVHPAHGAFSVRQHH